MAWVQYTTTRETGKRWGVSLQWVSQLCKQGRVEGAGKVGSIWIGRYRKRRRRRR